MAIKVGAAKASIDPAPELYPIPNSFVDWGRTEPLLQQCPYDSMYVRTIVIDNGKTSVVLMSWETMGYPGPPTLLDELTAEFGIPAEHFLICGTHNHSSAKDYHMGSFNGTPDEVEFHKKYWVIEIEAAKRSLREALDNMRPAKYGFGEIESFVNVNRDLMTPYGYWVEGKNFAGYSDKTLAILKFVDLEGRLIAAFCNYPMHNTCLHMMVDFDGRAKTSGNVSGVACAYAEEHFGEGAVVAWSSGAAGNQNPVFSHNLQYEYPDGYSASVPLPDGVGFMLMEYCGRVHGADIVKGLDAITGYSENLPVVFVRNDIRIPAQKRADGQGRGAPIRMGGNSLRSYDEIPFGRVPPLPELPEMVDDPEHPCELQMKLLILGDVALVCANAELYCEIGRDMKAAAPYRKTMVVTHADDRYRSTGYIMDKATAAKGAKVFQFFGRVKPGGADDLIVENELRMFDMALAAGQGKGTET